MLCLLVVLPRLSHFRRSNGRDFLRFFLLRGLFLLCRFFRYFLRLCFLLLGRSFWLFLLRCRCFFLGRFYRLFCGRLFRRLPLFAPASVRFRGRARCRARRCPAGTPLMLRRSQALAPAPCWRIARLVAGFPCRG